MGPIASNQAHAYARLSLWFVLATSIATTVHHYYRFGLVTLLLGALLVGLPVFCLRAFRRTEQFVALLGYGAVSAWIIIGFGLFDGWWQSTLKLFLGNFLLAPYGAYFSWAPVGGFGFEATGIVASFSSLFAAYYTGRFMQLALPVARGHSPSLGRTLLAVGVLGLLLLGYASRKQSGYAGPPAAGELIKIGVIVPTQGPQALLGSSFLKAVELAKAELPGTRYRYELVVADTGVNPIQTRAAIQKLIGVDKVKAIVGGISLPGEIIKPYASYAKIPHLCVCSVSRIGDGEYNFTNIPLPEDEAARWVQEAKRRAIGRVALLWQDYPSIDGHLLALRRELESAHIEVSFARRFARDTASFAAMVDAAIASRPDVYFVEAPEPALSRLGRQLKAAGVSNLSSIVAISISSDLGLFEGAWYTDSNLADADFAARFVKRFPGTRFATHMMPYAYDSLRLIVDGFESGRDPAQYIRDKTEYSGTPGRVWRLPGSGNYRSEPAVWIIKQGKPEILR